MIEYEMLIIVIRIVNFKTVDLKYTRIKNENRIGRECALFQLVLRRIALFLFCRDVYILCANQMRN